MRYIYTGLPRICTRGGLWVYPCPRERVAFASLRKASAGEYKVELGGDRG